MLTFKTNRYADLTEIVCSAPAPICPEENHVVAVISHTKGGKWSVLNHRFGERAVFPTQDAAKDFVHMRYMDES
jgi:hypothetical protein